MAHHCEGAIITCEDFRLHQRKDGRNYMAKFIAGLGMECDLITRGGGVQDLVRPKSEGYRDSMFRDAGVSAKLHHAKCIFLVNHRGCGAYSDFNFATREDELEQHKSDLIEAKGILQAAYPDKQIRMFFAESTDSEQDIFEEFIEITE